MKHFTTIELMVLLVISLGFSGCVGFQSFPLAARSGDTISLAIGGAPRHETVPGSQITLNDLNITIQQDINGNGVIEPEEVFAVKKRYLFRLYPDLTSYASNFTAVYGSTTIGQWSVVLDLVDPDTDDSLPLVGDEQAELVVTTSKFREIVFWPLEGSLNRIPITILPGTGESNHFNNDSRFSDTNIANLQPLPQLAISFSGSGSVAAVALDIDYDETVLTNASYIRIKQDIYLPDLILNQRVYSDNGNKKMRILLMTNEGALAPSDLKCFIVWDPSSIATGLTVTTGTFNVTSAKFYNESGLEVTGISVVKTLLYQ